MAFGGEVFKIWGTIGADTSDLDKKLTASSNKTAAFASKLGSDLKSLGKTMSIALTVPITAFAIKSVAAFEEHQRAMARTESVLKSTGNAAGVTATEINELTKSLGRKAAVDDDLVRSGANVLLTFTNIRNEAGANNDIFNQATRAALDLSAALGTDMAGAATIVGKALNSPVQGLAALTRVGVQFTEQQKQQIKTLVESGDTLAAQGIILDELGRRYGGAAEAQVTATARMKVALDDLAETFGTQLAPFVSSAANALDDFTQKAVDASDESKQMVTALIGIAALSGPLLTVAASFATISSAIMAANVSLVAFLGTAAGYILLAAAIAAVIYRVYKLSEALQTAGLPTKDLTLELIPALEQVAVQGREAGTAVEDLVAAIRDANEENATGISDWTFGLFQMEDAFKSGTVTAKEAARVLGELMPQDLRKLGRSGEDFVASWITQMSTVQATAQLAKASLINFAGMTGQKFIDWRNQVAGSFDIVSSALGDLKDRTKATFDEFMDSLQEQIDGWRNWRSNLKELIEKGASQKVIEDLLAMGPEQMGRIVELALKEPDEQIAEFLRGLETNLALPKNVVTDVSEYASAWAAALAEIKAKVNEFALYLQRTLGITSSNLASRLAFAWRGSGNMAIGAAGGIVTQPTIAMIGEAGPEAVVPLDQTPGSYPLPTSASTSVAVSVNLDRKVFGRQQEYLVRAAGF